eukprot:PITA_33231
MASFSILLNGSPSRTFMPSRGLKQGDPLSPFLFVLMVKGLGRAIKRENAEGRIQGIKITLDGDASTHQQFVDDTMLQGIPMVKEARAFKQILNDFALATGTEAVLQPIPIFMFSALPSPKGVMQQIKSMQWYFLWGKGEEKNNWALVACDKLWKPKSHGGLQLHNLETLNRVSGDKLWWRWLKESASPSVSFGNINMKIIGRRGIISKCLGSSKAPTFGTLIWRIEPFSGSIVSGRSRLGTLHGFGRIIGSRNQICLEKN